MIFVTKKHISRCALQSNEAAKLSPRITQPYVLKRHFHITKNKGNLLAVLVFLKSGNFLISQAVMAKYHTSPTARAVAKQRGGEVIASHHSHSAP